MRRMLCLVASLALLTANGFAAGLIIVDETHWPQPIPPGPIPPRPPRPIPPWPGPHHPRPHVFAPLAVNYVKVNTHISDQVAATSIDQEFSNPNAVSLEGTFIFPLPKGAQIDKFTMEIGGKRVEAELLKADKARGIYEDIVRKLRDPALLEYAGRDLFKVRIFPIEPHSYKRVSIVYTELLRPDNGLFSYRVPLNTEKFSAQPIEKVSVHVELETKRPLKAIYSANHQVEIKREGAVKARVGWEESQSKGTEDFVLYFAPEKDTIGVNLLTSRAAGEDGYFLLLASPGAERPKASVVLPKDVVFVLDTSGSMAGKKLEQAQKAMLFCIANLNDQDRFEIVRFSSEAEPLFERMVAATRENRNKAERFVQQLKPIGGTDIDEALKKAFALFSSEQQPEATNRICVVVFLTDGQPTFGPTDEGELLKNARSRNGARARLFAFGIGSDVNTHLIDKLTEEGRGSSQYVLPEEDIEVKVSNFFAKIKEPVLADPQLSFGGQVRATKIYPNPLPDLFVGEQLLVAGRYTGSGHSAITVDGKMSGTREKYVYEVQFPEESSENSFIPRLWATRRVGYLLDEIRLRGENSELRDEVTDLARKYGIVTPYTAYLIVEDEARRNVPVSQRSIQDLDRDKAVRAEAARTWSEFKGGRAGDSALVDAQFGQSLKAAEAPATLASSSAASFRRRYGLSGTSEQPATATRLVQYAQQSQFVAGKTFFENEGIWIDSAIQKNSAAKRVQVAFGSGEYFNLAKNPKIAPWLALGTKVQFVMDGTIYEVSD